MNIPKRPKTYSINICRIILYIDMIMYQRKHCILVMVAEKPRGSTSWRPWNFRLLLDLSYSFFHYTNIGKCIIIQNVEIGGSDNLYDLCRHCLLAQLRSNYICHDDKWIRTVCSLSSIMVWRARYVMIIRKARQICGENIIVLIHGIYICLDVKIM